MKKIALLGGLAAVLLIGAVYYGVRAQEARRPAERPGLEHMKAIRERVQLNLTDEQKEQIRGILTEARKGTIRKRADLEVARIELHELLRDKNGARAAILDKQGQVLSFQNEIAKSRLETRLRIRDVMTEEQWEKAGRMRNFMMFRRGMRGPAGAGRMELHRKIMPGGPRMGPWGVDAEGEKHEELTILPDLDVEPLEELFGALFGDWDTAVEEVPMPGNFDAGEDMPAVPHE